MTGAALLQPVQNTGGATQYQQHFTLSGKLSKSADTVQCDATSYQVAAYVTGNINGHKNRGVSADTGLLLYGTSCGRGTPVLAAQCLGFEQLSKHNSTAKAVTSRHRPNCRPTATAGRVMGVV